MGADGPPTSDAMMVTDFDGEQLNEVFLQSSVEDAKEAVLDGGAQSFVVGRNVLNNYADYLRTNGIGWSPKYTTCDKVFRFGNDETQHCTTATLIPVNFAGRTGHLHVHVLEGNTPFLFPRPLMEKFGLVVDYGRKRLQWDASSWATVRQKKAGGHYLLNLAEDPIAMRKEIRHPTFKNLPDEVMSMDHVLDIEEATGHVSDHNDGDDKNHLKDLPNGRMRGMYYAVDQQNASLQRELKASTKPLTRRRRCWEVFVGVGLVSQYLRQAGTEVKTFSLQNGWDLTDRHEQRVFLDMMDHEEPDDVWISPMCGPWSSLQELNSLTDDARWELEQKRKWHESHVLNFSSTVFNKQVQAGRYAHLEHPKSARSWRTRPFRRLMAKFHVEFDQCEYGLNVDGDGLNKKPTRVATNKRSMCMLHRLCSGEHFHVPLKGGNRPARAENYPPELAWRIAAIMAAPDQHHENDIFPLEDDEDWDMAAPDPEGMTQDASEQGATVEGDDVFTGKGLIERMNELKKECGESVFKYVRKLHNGMGHPSAAVLAKTLSNAKAREEVINCASRYECAACKSRTPPPTAAKSGPPPARHFNDRIQMDVLYIGLTSGRKVAVLHFVDVATRFGAARVLQQEQGPDIVQALERAWFRPYGAPKRLQMDEARPFCSQEVITAMERYGVEVDIAPGEAHTRLGIIERRHMVLRSAIETFLDSENLENTLDNVRDAVGYVAPTMNNLAFTKGYTPTQWVLNTNPRDPTSITADIFTPPPRPPRRLDGPRLRRGTSQTDGRPHVLHESRRGCSPPARTFTPPPSNPNTAGRWAKMFLLATVRRAAPAEEPLAWTRHRLHARGQPSHQRPLNVLGCARELALASRSGTHQTHS